MNKIYKVSLFSLILACVSSMPADARVTTKNSNRSYADAYQQVNAVRYQQDYGTTATTASATANLPVMVSDEELAKAIIAGTAENVSVSDLEACSMIYPSGVFRWEIPVSGVRRNQIPQCVSVVELRDATTNTVLATTTVASGDTFKCNIDSFPISGMSEVALSKVELPADVAPTMEDVEAVMNEEQKQNAGLKIAAAAIIGGVAGNMLGQKQAGDSKMFGTGKMQLIDTAVGTAAGAGIMAASSYSGKVAGDTIKSTAVNAASGMILGNMLAGTAGGDSVLATSKCSIEKVEKDCIPGTYYTKESIPAIVDGHEWLENEDATPTEFFFINRTNPRDMLKCAKGETASEFKGCTQISASDYIDVWCKTSSNGTSKCSTGLSQSENQALNNYDDLFELDTDSYSLKKGTGKSYAHVTLAYKANNKVRAYAVFDDPIAIKPLGYDTKAWISVDENHVTLEKDSEKTYSYKLYYRDSDGKVGSIITTTESAEQEVTHEFKPDTRDADDGALVDISNQARAKATIAGTAAGGALGGFAGYQGAQDEVSQRWVSAVREYEDSLSNFVCSTGTRFLSKYNDYVEIPEMKKSE